MKLKEIQKKSGYTREEVANKVGIKKSNYDNYLNGRNEPTIEILIKLANFFNVTLDELCGRTFYNKINTKQQELLNKTEALSDNDIDKIIGYADSLRNNQLSTNEKINNLLKDY